MDTGAQASLISQVVRALPRPLLVLLDAWSHRVARRRARERQRKWLQSRAAPPAQPDAPAYHLKPWRD
ncbi:MAG TPA: hypothetical protein VNB23_14445 [Ramlibacter sp.]|nr:hypothetical protein [Ramlibacter sp.]